MLCDAAEPKIAPDTWHNTFIHLPQLVEVTTPVNLVTGETYSFESNTLSVKLLLERFPICILFQRHRSSQPTEDES
jgi:hypothetical protein